MDDADISSDREAVALNAAVAAIRDKAAIAPGVPGECWRCGEESVRLVNGACAPCRDKWKLP